LRVARAWLDRRAGRNATRGRSVSGPSSADGDGDQAVVAVAAGSSSSPED
jgi:hypothetical protein